MDKQTQYATKIISQIGAMFEDDSENYIDKNELTEGNNATDFFYALSLASCALYSNLTGDKVDVLGYNHVANRLIAQNIKVDKS